jgi:hypothetical protein
VPAGKKENGKPGSHLAHMNDLIGDDNEKRENYRKLTEDAKFALLGTELLSTARAKVTFSLPLWCREHLEDLLISVTSDEGSNSGMETK